MYPSLIHDPILKAHGWKASAEGWIVTMRTTGGICCSGDGWDLCNNVSGGWLWACGHMILKSYNLLCLLKPSSRGCSCVILLINQMRCDTVQINLQLVLIQKIQKLSSQKINLTSLAEPLLTFIMNINKTSAFISQSGNVAVIPNRACFAVPKRWCNAKELIYN